MSRIKLGVTISIDNSFLKKGLVINARARNRIISMTANTITQHVRENIRRRITTQGAPQKTLSPKTINMRKGGRYGAMHGNLTPLRWSGTMYNSIEYKTVGSYYGLIYILPRTGSRGDMEDDRPRNKVAAFLHNKGVLSKGRRKKFKWFGLPISGASKKRLMINLKKNLDIAMHQIDIYLK